MTIPNTSLTSIVERIERIKDDIAIGQQDLKEVFAEAKATGLDVKVLKRLLKLRAADPAKAEELAAILETYAKDMGQPELPRLFV
ncbi:Azospirillum phage Cd, Gp10 [uncultured Caudovirales phage]|uniref:Azospirillum phage Cd, Gp10 n=1 Tax=uncultured Caudovirales phage TaxID=2100421 RepID=A0A6J5M0S5_9CAUD|nr:Azospirillum phage Cd, Gp10 [uncultured Caudovirales phage]